jgi:MFS family permease
MSFTSGPEHAPRWRDVYVAAGARGVSVCGDFLAATSLALTLQSAGAGGLAVSGLLLASTLPLVAFAPLAGRLADRVDSRALLIAAGLGQAAVCAALAFVSEPALLMALVALLATGLAVTQPTLAALLPDMVGRAHLPRASAINQTASSVGMLLGPALAGLLVGQFGVRVPLLLDAVSFFALVAAGLLLRTRRGGQRVPAATHAAATHAAETRPDAGWRLMADPILRALLVSLAAVLLAVGAVNVVGIFFVRETLGASTTAYGLLDAAWTGGILAGAWLFAVVARRMRTDGALVAGVLIQLGGVAATVALAAVVGAPAWLAPLWLVGGALNGGTNVFDSILMASRVPAAHRGRAFSALGAAANGAAMAGYLAGGVLLGHVGPRALLAGLGLTGVAVVLALIVPVAAAVRRDRSAPAGDSYATVAAADEPVPAAAG